MLSFSFRLSTSMIIFLEKSGVKLWGRLLICQAMAGWKPAPRRLNGGGGSFYHGDANFRKSGLILRQKLGQNGPDRLRFPALIRFPIIIVNTSNTVVHRL